MLASQAGGPGVTPSTQVKKLGEASHACNPSAGKTDRWTRPGLVQQPALPTCQVCGQEETLYFKKSNYTKFDICLKVDR